MTAIIKTKKKRPNYYIVIKWKNEMTGKRDEKWITTDLPVKGNNKRKVEELRQKIFTEYQEKGLELSLNNDTLFTDYLKEWLENHKYSITKVTYDSYKLIVYNQILPYFEPKKIKLADLKPAHIQEYIRFKLKTISPNTVRKHLFNISKCLDSAMYKDLIANNPVKRIELPKKVKYMGAKFYNESQIQTLLEIVEGDIIQPIVLMALFYGLRRSEIIGLKWDAIDLENKFFTVKHTVVRIDKVLHKENATKNKSSYRMMPMPNFITKIFADIKQKQEAAKAIQPNDYIDEGYVFTHLEDGRLILPNYVTKRFKKLIDNCSIPTIRFHDLRHSTASYLLSLGFSLKDIQYYMGHGDIGTTMNTYGHLDFDSRKNIVDVLDKRFEDINISMQISKNQKEIIVGDKMGDND